MILVGDVGGTKTLLALIEPVGRSLHLVAEARYESAEHRGLEPVVEAFLKQEGAQPEYGAFGVAGPVVEGRAELTNLDWRLDGTGLTRTLGFDVALLNDLEAAGYGLSDLTGEQVALLQPGEVSGGNRAIVAAGTGLGVSIVTEVSGHVRALPSEGGHADFAPRDDVEVMLLGWLRAKYGRVSAERVVSGPGIAEIYRFLIDTGRGEPSPPLASQIEAADDPSIAITGAALAGEPVCAAAVRLFTAAYGAFAGNVALTALALGGVWLAGGVAPAILPFLRDGSFVQAFRDKGRMSELVARVPIRVMLDQRAATLGAARYAMARAEGSL